MSRVIKFRVWDPENGIMIHGDDDEFLDYGIDFDLCGGWRIGEIDLGGDYAHIKYVGWRDFEAPMDRDNVILMQFTGLCDKNGEEIYEGDIVKFIKSHTLECVCTTDAAHLYGRKGIIVFKDGMFLIDKVPETPYRYIVGDYCKDVEVVGNIYENPELLEENKNG